MQLTNGLPKYSFDKQSFNIIFYKPLKRKYNSYPYWYFSPIDNLERAWGTIENHLAYRDWFEPLQLKHILQIKEPIEGQKKEFIIAFIKDLIEEIKTK